MKINKMGTGEQGNRDRNYRITGGKRSTLKTRGTGEWGGSGWAPILFLPSTTTTTTTTPYLHVLDWFVKICFWSWWVESRTSNSQLSFLPLGIKIQLYGIVHKVEKGQWSHVISLVYRLYPFSCYNDITINPLQIAQCYNAWTTDECSPNE